MSTWIPNKWRSILLSIVFTLYVIIPPIVLCFTVDNQKARIYTTNTALVNSTTYTIYVYDWYFLLYAFGFMLFSVIVWGFFQMFKTFYPKWIFNETKIKELNKESDNIKPNWNALLGIILFSYVFAFYIGVGARFSLQWYFILLILAYLIPYTYVCKHVDYKFKLKVKLKNSDKKKIKNQQDSDNSNNILTILCLCSFILVLSIYFVEVASTSNMILVTKVAIAIGIVFILMFMIYLFLQPRETIHIHHFIWSTLVVLVTGLDSWFMCLIQAFAIAVHLHGLAVFGYDHVVYTQYPGDLQPVKEEVEQI